MKDRLITFGGTGLVGEGISQCGTSIEALSSADVNITNKEEVHKRLERSESRTVLLLAAYTDVDGAQRDPVAAMRVNVEGTRNVINAADYFGLRVILVGTDFVFPGTLAYPGPYTEVLVPPTSYSDKSVGVYGTSKRLAEKTVLESKGGHAVVRISYPFGNSLSDGDFVNKVRVMLQKGYPIFADQYFTPTYIPDLASALNVIAENRLSGVYHVASRMLTTPYEMAQYVARKLNIDPESVSRGSIEDFRANYPDKAPRPQYGGLSTSATQERLGIQFHTWKEAIDAYFDIITRP